MVKLLVRNNDICRISKLLGRNQIKAHVTQSTIIIDTEVVADEIIDQICKMVDVIATQKSHDTTNAEIQTEEIHNGSVLQVAQENESIAKIEESESGQSISRKMKLEELIGDVDEDSILTEFYQALESEPDRNNDFKVQKGFSISEIKKFYRGEVYRWGSIKKDKELEGRKIKECIIIIQNDYLEDTSNSTIGLLCTSHYESRAPLYFKFGFSERNMIDYDSDRIGIYNATMFVSRIISVNRQEVGKYLGKMSSSFMSTLQPSIDYCLGIKRTRYLDLAQLQMLANVNIQELFAISEEDIKDSEKVIKFLEAFHFDMNRNGMDYVKEAILIASQKRDYRLEDLIERIAKTKLIARSEIQRLMVARIKEKFGFKKLPVISFIRLIDRLLKKEG